jgi:hypothetical protein
MKLLIVAMLLTAVQAPNPTLRRPEDSSTVKDVPSAPIQTAPDTNISNPSEAPKPEYKLATREILPHWYGRFERPDRLLVLVGLITCVVVMWQAWETRKSAQATEISAKAAERSIECMIDSERAWVLVQIGQLPEFTPIPSQVQILWLQPILTNHGKTPARVTKISVRQDQVPNINALPSEPEYQNERSVDIILPPGANIQPENVGVNASDFAAITQGTSRLFVYGFVDYADFGKKPRQTRFCLIYHVPHGFNPVPAGFYDYGNAPEAYTRCT